MASEPDEPVLHVDRLDYTPYPKSVHLARRRTAALMAEWGYGDLANDAALLLSELATNALLHGCLRGRLFRVELTVTPTVLRIAVSDPRNERLPCARRPSDSDQFGRGLLLVRALATRWGVRERTVGKEVWVEMNLTTAEPADATADDHVARGESRTALPRSSTRPAPLDGGLTSRASDSPSSP